MADSSDVIAPECEPDEIVRCPDFYEPEPRVRPPVEVWTPQRRTQARLDKLEALGSPKAIARYFESIGIVGDHNATSCPVARFIQRDCDGLSSIADGATVTHRSAVAYPTDHCTERYDLGPNVSGFVRSFDGGRFKSLRVWVATTRTSYVSALPPMEWCHICGHARFVKGWVWNGEHDNRSFWVRQAGRRPPMWWGVKPVLLDLFCCQGGAAMGYAAAGFRVVGVDIEPQPRYPFAFIQADALSFDLSNYDAVHASPPCQRFSDLAKRNDNADDWPDLIAPIRKRLEVAGVPWVIENVEGAPLREPVILCGTMFRGLRVLRHRLFESNAALVAPPHGKHPLVFTHDKRKAHYGKLDQDTSFVQVTGGGNATIENKRDAMGGLDWMDNHGVNEAIPPAYTEYLGYQLRAAVMLTTEEAA